MDTSKLSPDHFAGGVITKLAEAGMLSILAFPYMMPNNVTQMRVAGGGSHEGETPEDTARRELEDELSEKEKPFAIAPGSLLEIHRASVASQTGVGEHHKIFFLIPVEALTCTLRRERKEENDRIVLGIPAWHEAESLVRKMFADRTPKHHILAVLKAIKLIAEVSAPVAARYGAFLASNELYLKANS